MPTLEEWCRSDAAQLPKQRSEDHFPQYLERVFAEHKTAMTNLSGSPLEARIAAEAAAFEELTSGIRQCVDEYLEGRPSNAYLTFAKAMSQVSRHIQSMRVFPARNGLPFAFRMRTSVEPKRWSSEELFHIPFEKRGRVSSQRYSIQGLPCLYLGTSTYVCWEEMGRPPFASVYVMALRFADPENVHVLDLANVPRRLVSEVEKLRQDPAQTDLENYIVANAVCWPLVAACSTIAKEPSATFKPEYIVPQLLLQWVTQNTAVDGIRYCSTKVGNRTSPHLGTNYVFPVRSLQSKGYCSKLCSMFRVSPVVNWETLLACPPGGYTIYSLGDHIEAAPDALSWYTTTTFAKVDGMLLEYEGKPIC
ncbi:RES domain-containing protein [Polyangium jinanense]|uniref:RES domain-containing protein n=1 Tax=Polyangium jinanense TaxID=2829994 RepID=UPI0023406575|nr:RES domain-containing protein [Polyangium jinanense]MDC3960713.1 RES domain-containing protein [Polyangium jinanense]